LWWAGSHDGKYIQTRGSTMVFTPFQRAGYFRHPVIRSRFFVALLLTERGIEEG